MPNSTPGSAPLAGRAPAPGQRAALFGFLWATASLATALGIFGLTHLLAHQHHRDAGRMIVAEQKGVDYLGRVVSGFAARHGRPAGL